MFSYGMDYYTTDHLGSVRVITDMDGEICQNPSLNVANPVKSEYLYEGKSRLTESPPTPIAPGIR